MDELEALAQELRRAVEEMHADYPEFRDFCLYWLECEVERVRREDSGVFRTSVSRDAAMTACQSLSTASRHRATQSACRDCAAASGTA